MLKYTMYVALDNGGPYVYTDVCRFDFVSPIPKLLLERLAVLDLAGDYVRVADVGVRVRLDPIRYCLLVSAEDVVALLGPREARRFIEIHSRLNVPPMG